MSKKYVPSGYQIINITDTDIDDDGYLILDHEDCKVLFDIMVHEKYNKPILLSFNSQENTLQLIGFANIYLNAITLSEIVISGGAVSGGNSVAFNLESNEKISVSVNEI